MMISGIAKGYIGDKAKEFLAANPEILNQVETLVREKLSANE